MAANFKGIISEEGKSDKFQRLYPACCLLANRRKQVTVNKQRAKQERE